eukprot:354554-Chlamydomonas_euryale.AAC.5
MMPQKALLLGQAIGRGCTRHGCRLVRGVCPPCPPRPPPLARPPIPPYSLPPQSGGVAVGLRV